MEGFPDVRFPRVVNELAESDGLEPLARIKDVCVDEVGEVDNLWSCGEDGQMMA